jgi:hypothetical protein
MPRGGSLASACCGASQATTGRYLSLHFKKGNCGCSPQPLLRLGVHDRRCRANNVTGRLPKPYPALDTVVVRASRELDGWLANDAVTVSGLWHAGPPCRRAPGAKNQNGTIARRNHARGINSSTALIRYKKMTSITLGSVVQTCLTIGLASLCSG